jgi:hypothetical protein
MVLFEQIEEYAERHTRELSLFTRAFGRRRTKRPIFLA